LSHKKDSQIRLWICVTAAELRGFTLCCRKPCPASATWQYFTEPKDIWSWKRYGMDLKIILSHPLPRQHCLAQMEWLIPNP